MPAFDEGGISRVLVAGLCRFVAGRQNGTILSFSDYYNKAQRACRRNKMPKPNFAQMREALPGICSEGDFFRQLDRELRLVCGNWIPIHFCSLALHSDFYRGRGCLASFVAGNKYYFDIKAGDVDRATKTLLNALRRKHADVNQLLTELHKVSTGGMVSGPVPIDEVRRAMVELVHRVLEEEGSEDRWFGCMPHSAMLYLESVGCNAPFGQIDDIADKHFSSWVDPEPNATAEFADEIAALSVKQRFREKYGELDE